MPRSLILLSVSGGAGDGNFGYGTGKGTLRALRKHFVFVVHDALLRHMDVCELLLQPQAGNSANGRNCEQWCRGDDVLCLPGDGGLRHAGSQTPECGAGGEAKEGNNRSIDSMGGKICDGQ